MELLGQATGDLVPGDMGKRVAVKQQQRRPVAAVPQMDSRAARRDFHLGEPFEHPLPPSNPRQTREGNSTRPFGATVIQGKLWCCRGGEVALGDRRFVVELIKPSHYDDDGYVIQWWRSWIPSNSLACLYGIATDLARRRALGLEVAIDIRAYDECHTVIPVTRIIRRIKNADAGLVCLVGVQSNQFPRAMDLAGRFRAAGVQVAVGGFHP